MKKKIIFLILNTFIIFQSIAQDKIKDYSVFYTELDSTRLHRTKFIIEKYYDSLNISDLIFGKGFRDSIQIFINDSLIYKGKIQSDPSSYIVEQRWTVNRAKENIIQITFNNKSCLEFKYEKEFRFLIIDKINGKYFLTYSKTNAFNHYR